MRGMKAFRTFCKACFDTRKLRRFRDIKQEFDTVVEAVRNLYSKNPERWSPLKKEIEKIKKVMDSKV